MGGRVKIINNERYVGLVSVLSLEAMPLKYIEGQNTNIIESVVTHPKGLQKDFQVRISFSRDAGFEIHLSQVDYPPGRVMIQGLLLVMKALYCNITIFKNIYACPSGRTIFVADYTSVP